MRLDVFSRKLVLHVEDEPLIALDIEQHLRKSGARVIAAANLEAALSMATHPHLSAAIVDLRLGQDSAIALCRRLVARSIPFIVHTGYAADAVQQEWPTIPVIQKPATPQKLIASLARSLSVREGREEHPVQNL